MVNNMEKGKVYIGMIGSLMIAGQYQETETKMSLVNCRLFNFQPMVGRNLGNESTLAMALILQRFPANEIELGCFHSTAFIGPLDEKQDIEFLKVYNGHIKQTKIL